jgi:membrane protease YdiL (CAAX protease family)
VGPDTKLLPTWPGPTLAVIGVVIALVGLTGQALPLAGFDVETSAFGWVAALGLVVFGAGLVYASVRQLRIRRHLPPERYRGPAVFVLVLLALAIAFLLTLPFGADAAVLVLGEGELSLLGSIALLVSTQLGLLLVSWFAVFRPNALAALPSIPGRNAGRAVAAGLGWGLLAWFGSSVVAFGWDALLRQVGIETEAQAAEQAIALVDPWIVVIAIVVLAPIAEEVFFRGVVFNALRREGGRRWAYLGSSILFAVIHLSLLALVPIFLLGLALAWVYERTNNLLAPIAMHATVNAVSVALALLVRFEVVPLPT